MMLALLFPLLFLPGNSEDSSPAKVQLSDLTLEGTREGRIEMSISSPEKIAGLQFRLEYDPQKVLLGKPEFSPNNQHFSLFAKGDSDRLEIVAYSVGGKELDLTAPVLSIPLSPAEDFRGTVDLVVKDFMASTPEGGRVRVKVSGGRIHVLPPLPERFQMSQNFPNPFSHETVIKFDLPEDAVVRVGAYTVRGEKIRLLKDGVLRAGFHEVKWDGTDELGRPVSPGAYVCSLKVGAQYHTMKMLLLR